MEVRYDYLILATGTRHAYFDHPEWEALAPGLKSLEDAREMRRRFLLAFEEAEKSDDAREREELLTFVIVGGGPTGAELAGEVSTTEAYVVPAVGEMWWPQVSQSSACVKNSSRTGDVISSNDARSLSWSAGDSKAMERLCRGPGAGG